MPDDELDDDADDDEGPPEDEEGPPDEEDGPPDEEEPRTSPPAPAMPVPLPPSPPTFVPPDPFVEPVVSLRVLVAEQATMMKEERTDVVKSSVACFTKPGSSDLNDLSSACTRVALRRSACFTAAGAPR